MSWLFTSRCSPFQFAPVEAEVLLALGVAQSDTGDGSVARRTLRDAANLAEANHHDVVAAWCWVALAAAQTQEFTGMPAEEELIARARSAVARIGGDTELEGRLLYHEGLHFIGAGRLDQAEEALERSRQMLQHVAPDELPLLDEGLGLLFERRGELSRALEAYQRVLAARLTRFGEGHPDLFYAHTNLGSTYAHLGRAGEGLTHVQKALALVSARKGEENLEFAHALHNVGETLRTLGRSEEALPLLLRARAIMMERGGRNTPALALMVENTGGVLIGLGRYGEAVDALREALSMYRALRGEDHAEVGKCRLNLGEALLRARRVQDALVEMQEGQRILAAGLGEGHPFTAYAHAALGKALLAAGRSSDAADRLRHAVAAYQKLEFDPLQVADAMFDLAKALDARRGKDRAESLKWASEAERRWAQAPAGWEPQLAEVRQFVAARTEGRRGPRPH